MPRKIMATGLSAVIAFSLVGCSSTGSSQTGSTGTSTAAKPPANAKTGGAAANIDTCSLVTIARAESATDKKYSAAASTASGPDVNLCTYTNVADGTAPASDLLITIMRPGSGVTFKNLTDILRGVGVVKDISSEVGTTATIGSIELDVQAPDSTLIAIQGAGGTLSGQWSDAVVLAKTVMAGLH